MVEEEEGSEARPLQREGESRSRRNQKRGLVGLISRPINWVKMLSDELHWSFVVGVVVVYGINQGLGFGLSRVSTQYYMKDEQKVQPSQAQILVGIIHIPWILKPLWGLLSDVVPVFGYRRRPYFVLAGFLGIVSMLVLSMQKNLHLAFALVCLVAGSAGIAFADVAIDACVTQNSISHPHLAGDMQSLCGMSTSIGAFLGFSFSGVFVHLVGPTGVYGLLSVPAGLVVLVGMLLRESHIRNSAHKKVRDKFAEAGRTMWATLKCRDVWRSCLYMHLSIALGLHIHEGMFYWYTDAKDGPCFSQEVVGSIFSIGAAGSLLGVVLYQNLLKNHPFRDILFWTQLLHGLSGLLDLVLVWRINLKFGVPDYFFVVLDEALSRLISRIKWMPFLVLSSKLCPAGIEGTFFALIMSIDHVGMLSSAWGGGLLLHFLKVTRTQFENLWVAILVRSVLRIVPLAFLFLIPGTDPSLSVLPAEMLKAKKGDDILGHENVELASLISTS